MPARSPGLNVQANMQDEEIGRGRQYVVERVKGSDAVQEERHRRHMHRLNDCNGLDAR